MKIPNKFNRMGVSLLIETVPLILEVNTEYGYTQVMQCSCSKGGVIDWGDGVVESFNDVYLHNVTHSYDTINTFTITAYNFTFFRAFPEYSEYPSLVTKLIQIGNTITDCTSMCFRCYHLSSIADGFVIPDNVTCCHLMFNFCTSLITLPDSFKISNNATTCYGMFSACSSLLSLPDGFTIPESVTNCEHFLSYCTVLTSLPESFKIPSNITTFNSFVSDCQLLVFDISNLFSDFTQDNIDATSAFYKCYNITGIAPADKLWNRTNINWTSSDCFYGCTNLSNYNDIATTWGGA